MAYFSFKDVSLFFGTGVNSSVLPTSGNKKEVYASNVQLNYTPNISQQRFLGQDVDKSNFGLAGTPNSTISFTCYVRSNGDGTFNPIDYTGDVGDLGATMIIGDLDDGIKISGAFLTSYSFALTPYQTVAMQCDFAIYNPLTETGTGSRIFAKDNSPDSRDFGVFGHGAYSSILGTNSLQGNIETVGYQFSAQRQPVYNIGQYSIAACELVTAEHSISISSENIQNLVAISGNNYGSTTIDLKNSSNTNVSPTITVDGRVTSQNISASAGGLARGSISVTQPLK
jgi:hypothetical protein